MIQSKSPIKIAQFKELVNSFKKHHFSSDVWINPYEIKDIVFENGIMDFKRFCEKHNSIEVLNPWNWWYGNLDADILLIGQDWGAIDSTGGIRELFNPDNHYISDTDKNLIELFKELGFNKIVAPYDQIKKKESSEDKLFFTNAILGIRKGNKDSGKINLYVYKETSCFLFSLINIIKPRYIIAMGGIAYKTIHHIYNHIHKPIALYKLIQLNEKDPKIDIDGAKLFVSYHCSNSNIKRTKYKVNGIETKLKIEILKDHWKEIKNNMQK